MTLLSNLWVSDCPPKLNYPQPPLYLPHILVDQDEKRPTLPMLLCLKAGWRYLGNQAPHKQEHAVNRINHISADQFDNVSSTSTYNIQSSTYSVYNYIPYSCVSPSTSWTPSFTEWSPDSYMSLLMPPASILFPPQLPMAKKASPFNLCFISGNIAKCASCSYYIRATYTSCVWEWRVYTPPGGEQQSKFSPVYYHINMMCIQQKWPAFNQKELVISEEVSSKLTPVHKDYWQLLEFMCERSYAVNLTCITEVQL